MRPGICPDNKINDAASDVSTIWTPDVGSALFSVNTFTDQ